MGIFIEPTVKDKSQTILGMVLLANEDAFSYEQFVDYFEHNYHDLQEASGGDVAAAFKINEEEVYLMNISAPIPFGDIEKATEHAYHWSSALEDTKDHRAHVVIALINGNHNPIKRFRLHTQLICSVLMTSQAIGVYIGEQSLLIAKDDYLFEAQKMSDSYLPVNLWIYFGLRIVDGKSNGYTYGLKAFDKEELEVLNSDKRLFDIRELLVNITHYVLMNDINFKSKQTVGYTESQKINISYSKGTFIGGNSFKLAYL
jgi:hypothetical protein